jgi:hypothetical protein
MTADTAVLSRADRERLATRVRELHELGDLMRRPGLLSSPDEPPPLHRSHAVTALPVTAPGTESSLTAPARAVPLVRPPGEPAVAPSTDPRRPIEPLLHLPAQPPDRRLGRAQLGDHPRLDGHLADKGIEVNDAEGRDGIDEPLLDGMPGHVTTISVTPPEGTTS